LGGGGGGDARKGGGGGRDGKGGRSAEDISNPLFYSGKGGSHGVCSSLNSKKGQLSYEKGQLREGDLLHKSVTTPPIQKKEMKPKRERETSSGEQKGNLGPAEAPSFSKTSGTSVMRGGESVGKELF